MRMPASDKAITTILNLNVATLYPRKMKTKVRLLSELAAEENAFAILLTETHLKEEICAAEVHMEGFTLYREDRIAEIRKGGVAIYLRNDVAKTCKKLVGGSRGNTEYLFLRINDNTILGVIYRANSGPPENFLEVLQAAKEYLEPNDGPEPNIIIAGDFNFPGTDWAKLKTSPDLPEPVKIQARALFEEMENCCLTQIVERPTRGENILDLILTNCENIILETEVRDTIMSDHRLIITKTAGLPIIDIMETKFPANGFDKLNFYSNTIDWQRICEAVGLVAWQDNMHSMSTNEKWKFIKENLLKICNTYVPEKKGTSAKRRIPRDRRILMRKRCKLKKKLKSDINHNALNKIKENLLKIEKELNESCRRELELEEAKAIEAIRRNPKYFYSYTRRKANVRETIGPLEEDGHIVAKPDMICELFQTQFSSVYSTPREIQPLQELENVTHEKINVTITQEHLIEAAKQLSETSAAGPDGIPAVLVKRTISELSLPLSILWQSSLDTGEIPEELKEGRVTPIHKGGSKLDKGNYRPITLTSHIIKIMERVVCRQLTEYLEANKLMNENQHGFRAGRSCTSQLLQHLHTILRNLEEEKDTEVIYLDFAKAFDKVDHNLLLRKLSRFGIRGRLLQWIASFLANRSQVVATMGAVSRPSPVISGVPQGTVLGPILFLIYIWDLDKDLEGVTISSFADDTRIVGAVKSDEDAANIQLQLNKIYNWASENNMSFNATKFVHLHYSSGPTNSLPIHKFLAPNQQIITSESTVRDLGVLMCTDLSSNEQVTSMVAQARKRMGWILRTFACREKQPMLTLFKSLILPLVEYCCQIWSPGQLGMIRRLESVQRTFTYKIEGQRNNNYWERLKCLDMFSLERRRERYILIYIWKIIQNKVPNIYEGDLPTVTCYRHQRRGLLCRVPSANYRAPARIKNKLDESLPVIGSRLFNCLPAEIREVEGGLDSFKKKLDTFLRTIPDKPVLPHYYQTSPGNSLLQQIQVIGDTAN